jgi:hypothetical protein
VRAELAARGVGLLTLALLPLEGSCASGPCRPLANPKPVPMAFHDVGQTDICKILAGTGAGPPCSDPGHPLFPERCLADDPDCGPILVAGNETCFRTKGPRKALYHHNAEATAQQHCTYDGECSLTALCTRYDQPVFRSYVDQDQGPRDPFADSWGGRFANPTWCGCIEGHCDFFTQ